MKNKSKMKQYMILIAFGVILFWLLNNYSLLFGTAQSVFSVLSPVIIGFCIAFILNVPMSSIERRIFKPSRKTGELSKLKAKIKRPVSIFVVILLFFFIIFMIFYLVIPALINTLTQLTEDIPDFVNQLSKKINNQPLITNWLDNINLNKDTVIETNRPKV